MKQLVEQVESVGRAAGAFASGGAVAALPAGVAGLPALRSGGEALAAWPGPGAAIGQGARGPLARRLILLRRITPFTAVHLATIGVLFVSFSWELVAACLFTYCFFMVGMAGWMHRYFSHRTFSTARWFQFVLAFWAGCAAQRGTLWWAAHHRRHHAFAETEDDPHSPTVRDFWKPHLVWIFEDAHQPSNYKWVRDLARYPELRFLDRWYWTPPILYWCVFAALGAAWGEARGIGAADGAWAMIVWGPVLGTVLAWHATFCINSVTHMWGRRRYDTGDDSRNVGWLSWLNFGEGWHNNHHYYPHSANLGFHWWEVDPAYYVILALERLGLVWDVRKAPRKAVEGQVRRAKPRPEHASLG